MDLHKVIEVLGDTRREYAHIHSMKGQQDIDGQLYSFKAYTIGKPHDLIRIDLKKIGEDKCKK